MKDLCEHFGADSPAGLNRRMHKDTTCGASISIYGVDGQAFHNGEKAFETLDEDYPVQSFTIQTIVEGSEATVDSDRFVLPVATEVVDKWIEYMENEADLLWDDANVTRNDNGEEINEFGEVIG